MPNYFPKDIAHLIGEYAMQWMVLPWVLERAPPLTKYHDPCNKILHWHGELVNEADDEFGSGITDAGGILISSWDPKIDVPESVSVETDVEINPNADRYDNDSDHYLWENPRAEDFVRGLLIDWNALAANPADWALDLMEQLKLMVGNLYPWNNLCRNINPRARALWDRARPSDLDWGWLSANPNAMNKIRACWRDPNYTGGVIDQWFILWNPAAKSFIKDEYKIDINNANVCYNPNPWPAMRKVQESYTIKEALYFGFGRNPQPWAIERMRNYDGEWTPRMRGYLYTNPNPEALAMIRDNPERFPLAPVIWSNPAIFELVVPPGMVDIITSIQFD